MGDKIDPNISQFYLGYVHKVGYLNQKIDAVLEGDLKVPLQNAI